MGSSVTCLGTAFRDTWCWPVRFAQLEEPPTERIPATPEQPASTERLLYASPGLRHWVYRPSDSPRSPWVGEMVSSPVVQVPEACGVQGPAGKRLGQASKPDILIPSSRSQTLCHAVAKAQWGDLGERFFHLLRVDTLLCVHECCSVCFLSKKETSLSSLQSHT